MRLSLLWQPPDNAYGALESRNVDDIGPRGNVNSVPPSRSISTILVSFLCISVRFVLYLDPAKPKIKGFHFDRQSPLSYHVFWLFC